MKGRISQYAKFDFLNLVHFRELSLAMNIDLPQIFQSMCTNSIVWMDSNLCNYSHIDAYSAFLAFFLTSTNNAAPNTQAYIF